ncbi:MAG: DUF354 domain-containing protein [Sedimentisphaerales bacterium]|nr:DUF354 domain-containing protein [Sedimentisphaerales bacterium]
MKILFDITHPGHVHFFRNAISELKKRGHTTGVTTREKDVTTALLDNFQIPYTVLSRAGTKKISLLSEMLLRDVRLLRYCRRFRPDVLTAISGVFAAHAGGLLRKPVIVWDDTEHQKFSHMITYPFVRRIHSPDCYEKSFGRKHHLYAGCHELAYLHPNRFKADVEVVKELGIDPAKEKYCIIRFVSWQAHHDVGQHGFADKHKLRFIEEISKYAKPYISSEGTLPDELKPYLLNVPAHKIHHVMAFASLYVGEGATMASESAVLGVPALYINTLKLGYINMLERYGLVKQTTDTEQALEQSIEWLKDTATPDRCREAREKLLSDKIDVTDYIVKMIEQAEEAQVSQRS